MEVLNRTLGKANEIRMSNKSLADGLQPLLISVVITTIKDMVISNDHTQKVMSLLVELNPLGDRANSILDLDNYRTEAIDILFQLGLAGSKANFARVLQDVINQAFDLSLSIEECSDTGRKIKEIITKSL